VGFRVSSAACAASAAAQILKRIKKKPEPIELLYWPILADAEPLAALDLAVSRIIPSARASS
jgi:hypothetical protein